MDDRVRALMAEHVLVLLLQQIEYVHPDASPVVEGDHVLAVDAADIVPGSGGESRDKAPLAPRDARDEDLFQGRGITQPPRRAKRFDGSARRPRNWVCRRPAPGAGARGWCGS